MPANTPIYGFPYPLGTDPVSQGDNDIRALAEDVETVIAANTPGLVLINQATVSPIALDFLVTGFTNAYDTFRLVMQINQTGIDFNRPLTGVVQTASSEYNTAYSGASWRVSPNGTSGAEDTRNPGSNFVVGNLGHPIYSLMTTMDISGMNTTSTQFRVVGQYLHPMDYRSVTFAYGNSQNTLSLDRIKFFVSGGSNLPLGKWALYGYKK